MLLNFAVGKVEMRGRDCPTRKARICWTVKFRDQKINNSRQEKYIATINLLISIRECYISMNPLIRLFKYKFKGLKLDLEFELDLLI